MPERSFGRTVRYRRTKLGLSQAKLGELVGRSTATIRSWERDKTRPNDEKVLSTLAAILGVEERQLFEKAEVEPPKVVETSPTVEQALASLRVADEAPVEDDEMTDHEPSTPAPVMSSSDGHDEVEHEEPGEDEGDDADLPVSGTRRPVSVAPTPPPAPAPLFAASSAAVAVDEDEPDVSSPGYLPAPEPYVQTPLTPTLADISYIEDASQRQLYRVRNLATLVAVVALIVAFVWAVGEGLGALGDWWNEFFGNLRL